MTATPYPVCPMCGDQVWVRMVSLKPEPLNEYLCLICKAQGTETVVWSRQRFTYEP